MASEMFFVTSGAVDEVVESQVALYMIKCCHLSCHLWHFEESRVGRKSPYEWSSGCGKNRSYPEQRQGGGRAFLLLRDAPLG